MTIKSIKTTIAAFLSAPATVAAQAEVIARLDRQVEELSATVKGLEAATTDYDDICDEVIKRIDCDEIAQSVTDSLDLDEIAQSVTDCLDYDEITQYVTERGIDLDEIADRTADEIAKRITG